MFPKSLKMDIGVILYCRNDKRWGRHPYVYSWVILFTIYGRQTDIQNDRQASSNDNI